LFFKNALSFQELLDLYDVKLVASYEKSLGQTLLGNEISGLAYWNFADKNREGFMSLAKFVEFMKVYWNKLKIFKEIFRCLDCL